jgi:probable HAF family extracellular repeat protein
MRYLLPFKIAGTLVIFVNIVFCSVIPSQAQTTYTVTDLGVAASGGLETNPNDINIRGEAVAVTFESFFPVFETIGFVSKDGQITLLPSLGGQSTFASSINASGVVAGSANFLGDTITHAVIWDRDLSRVTDLGTLGGSTSAALWLNNSNQVVGDSGTSNGIDVHAFFWDRGKLIDLGSLGGATSLATGINNSALVVGQSDITTELDPVFGIPTFHGFTSVRSKLNDVGNIFGGHFNYAQAVNDRGDIVGAADVAEDITAHAFLIRNGSIVDLGTVAGDTNSAAFGINNRGQIVGISALSFSPPPTPPVDNWLCPCHAAIWENGKATDLNTAIPANTGWQLIGAIAINDRGEIVGNGTLNNEFRAFLLTPNTSNVLDSVMTNSVSAVAGKVEGPRSIHSNIVNGKRHMVLEY